MKVWPLVLLLVAALLAGPPARHCHAAWPSDPLVNVPVCVAPGAQPSPQTQAVVISDGVGGLFLAWLDERGGAGSYAVYLQRLTSDGVPVAGWPANGLVVCTTGTQYGEPAIVADGSGGVLLVWEDSRNGAFPYQDLYAQRITSAGAVSSGWPATGTPVCQTAGASQDPRVVSDGANGMIVVWGESRAGAGARYYAKRIQSSGAAAGGWPTDGATVCSSSTQQSTASVVADGAGGVIVAWADMRSGEDDVYAQRLNAAGLTQWTPAGVPVCTLAGAQFFTHIVSDGANGAIIAWDDGRTAGTPGIYAQRLLASGAVASGWTADGVMLSSQTGDAEMISDGAGGAFIAWWEWYRNYNYDIYAQRITSSGQIASGWVPGGSPVCVAPGTQAWVTLALDGSGGVLVAYTDERNGPQVYAQRLTGAGQPLAAWSTTGRPVTLAPGMQSFPKMLAAASGSAIVVWQDERSGNPDLYAQRIYANGRLGFEPYFLDIRDVTPDQGGRVLLEWGASVIDTVPSNPIAQYTVWRRVPSAPNIAGPGAPAAAGRRSARTSLEGGRTLYWEYLGAVPARAFGGYSYIATTLSDSMAGSNPPTSFMVMAEASGGYPYWQSPADSAYSVDNLAPAMPAAFTGSFGSGSTVLHWGANHEADFSVYEVHRGSSAGFTPGVATLLAVRPDTGFVDVTSTPGYYKLCAVDVHGNHSPFAVVLPSGMLGVAEDNVSGLTLEPVRPNPLRSGTVDVSFTTSEEGPTTLDVFDVSGRRVEGARIGVLAAGRYAVRLGSQRMLPPGLYMVRLAQGSRSRIGRFVVMR